MAADSALVASVRDTVAHVPALIESVRAAATQFPLPDSIKVHLTNQHDPAINWLKDIAVPFMSAFLGGYFAIMGAFYQARRQEKVRQKERVEDEERRTRDRERVRAERERVFRMRLEMDLWAGLRALGEMSGGRDIEPILATPTDTLETLWKLYLRHRDDLAEFISDRITLGKIIDLYETNRRLARTVRAYEARETRNARNSANYHPWVEFRRELRSRVAAQQIKANDLMRELGLQLEHAL